MEVIHFRQIDTKLTCDLMSVCIIHRKQIFMWFSLVRTVVVLFPHDTTVHYRIASFSCLSSLLNGLNSIIALFIAPVMVGISTNPMGLGLAELVLNGAGNFQLNKKRGGGGRIFSPFSEWARGNVAPFRTIFFYIRRSRRLGLQWRHSPTKTKTLWAV